MKQGTETLKKSQLKDLPEIRPGDTIVVYQKISARNTTGHSGTDEEKKKKTRLQAFEGIVLARKHGKGISATITVRKVSLGVGIEKIFPIHSPLIEKFEIVRHGKVRRAKLYYLRKAKGKRAKIKEKKAKR